MRETRRKAIALLAVLQLMTVAPALGPGSGCRAARSRPGRSAWSTISPRCVDPASRDSLDDLLTRLRGATGAEVAVVTLPTIDDRDEAEVALDIGRAVGRRCARRASAIRGGTRDWCCSLVPRQNHQPGTGHVRIEVGEGARGHRHRRGQRADPARGHGAAARPGAVRPGDRGRRPRARRASSRAGTASRDSTLAAAPLPAGGAPGPARSSCRSCPILLFILFVILGQPGRSPAPGILGWALDRRRRVGRWRLGRRRGRGRRRVRRLRRRRRIQRWRLGRDASDARLGRAGVVTVPGGGGCGPGRGYSAVLYGSAARGDYIAGRSDINLMLVLDDPSPGAPAGLAPAFAHVAQGERRAAAPDQPGGVGARHRRLPHRDHRHAGGLPRASRRRPAGARAGRSARDLRQALERELRGKLLRLRQGYAVAAGDHQASGRAGGRKRRHDPGAAARAPHARGATGARRHPRRWRRRRPRCWACTPERSRRRSSVEPSADGAASPTEFEQYLDAVAHAAEYVDHLQLGDQ